MTKLVPLLAALALVAAGCGGDPKGDYISAVNDAQDKYGKAISEAADPNPTAATFDRQSVALMGMAEAIRDVDTKDLEEVREARDGYAAAIEKAAEATDTDGADMKLVTQNVKAALQSFNAALDRAEASVGGPTFATITVFAGGSFSSGGSRSSGGSSSSGGSKSYGGGGGSKSSGSSSSSSKSSGSSKPATSTASKPSTGSKSQPAPVTKIIPPAPPKITVPKGVPPTKVTTAFRQGNRSYSADRAFIQKNPRYADPYYRGSGQNVYYGYDSSPFFYLWLFSMMDGDHSNDPLPPESETDVTEAVISYLGIIQSEKELVSR